MVVATIRIQTTPEKRKELLQTFRSLSDPIQSENGCRSCRVYREVGNDEAVILVEEWDSKSDWESHIQTDEFAVIVGAMSLLQQSESVEFQLLDRLEGSESVDAIRARNFKHQGDDHEFPKTKTAGSISSGRLS